jgi:hypothetical protein
MLRLFRAWRDRAVTALPQAGDLSPHLLKDLNLWNEPGFGTADSIRTRKLRQLTLF